MGNRCTSLKLKPNMVSQRLEIVKDINTTKIYPHIKKNDQSTLIAENSALKAKLDKLTSKHNTLSNKLTSIQEINLKTIDRMSGILNEKVKDYITIQDRFREKNNLLEIAEKNNLKLDGKMKYKELTHSIKLLNLKKKHALNCLELLHGSEIDKPLFSRKMKLKLEKIDKKLAIKIDLSRHIR